jgi:hypothetical protein
MWKQGGFNLEIVMKKFGHTRAKSTRWIVIRFRRVEVRERGVKKGSLARGEFKKFRGDSSNGYDRKSSRLHMSQQQRPVFPLERWSE